MERGHHSDSQIVYTLNQHLVRISHDVKSLDVIQETQRKIEALEMVEHDTRVFLFTVHQTKLALLTFMEQ